MHKNNDPKSDQTVDGHMRIITSLTATRCTTLNDLRERLEKYDVALHKYDQAGGEKLGEPMKRHHLISITPARLYEMWQVQPGFMTWDAATIKSRMLEMIAANHVFGIESNIKHGLYAVEDNASQPCGGGDSNHGGCAGCNHHKHDDQTHHVSYLKGYDLDDTEMEVNLIEHVQNGLDSQKIGQWPHPIQ